MLNDQQRGQIEEELAGGRLIQAIKLYREFTGVGLKEAKDAVEAWYNGQGAPQGVAETAPRGIRVEVERELRRLMEEGKKIEAIRRLREETGLGLKEAKDAIDALEREMPTTPKKAGCMGVVILVGAAAAAAWKFIA